MHSWRLVTQETATPSPHWSPRATLHPATPLPKTGAPSCSLWATTSTTCIDFSFQKKSNARKLSQTPLYPHCQVAVQGLRQTPNPKGQLQGDKRSASDRLPHTQTHVHTQTRTPSLQLLICRRMAGAGTPESLTPEPVTPQQGHRWCLKTGLREEAPSPSLPHRLLPGQTQSW